MQLKSSGSPPLVFVMVVVSPHACPLMLVPSCLSPHGGAMTFCIITPPLWVGEETQQD